MDQDQPQDAPQNPPPSNQEPPTDEQREQQRITAQRILMAIRIQKEANRIMDDLRDQLPPRDWAFSSDIIPKAFLKANKISKKNVCVYKGVKFAISRI